MYDRMSHSGFKSREYSRKKEKRWHMRYFPRERYGGGDTGGASMMAKMGICALMFGLVLLYGRVGHGEAAVVQASANGWEDTQDYLGKLRFVELPGIIQVFSSETRLNLGLEYTGEELLAEDTLLRVYGAAGQDVASPADCTVKSASGGGESYRLELSLDGDVVLSLNGLTRAAVEEGQPLKAGDTLGDAGEALEISISQAGRPLNPQEYVTIGEKLA